jgi:hypothetical protein
MHRVLIVLMGGLVTMACAQDSMRVNDGFSELNGHSSRKIVATGIVGATIAISLVWAYDSWWRDTSPFSFRSENWLNGEHRGIDKAGHLYTSYFYFHTLRNVMLWGGHDPVTARWWGAGAAAFFALTVEIGDGFSGVGFDYQDLVFNAVGVGYGWLQTEVPFLKNFCLKWSYIPRDRFDFPPRFTQHYDAHTYWLTANINELLPALLEPYWPDFLQIAVGYGVDENMTKREAVIGLDYNLEVIPTHSEDLLLIKRTLNMFHYPAPAVKFTETKSPKYYLFHTN